MNEEATLPDKPSELITVAIRDLKECIAKGMQVSMGIWVLPHSDVTQCYVCLAGAVMCRSLRLEDELRDWEEGEEIFPPDYSEHYSSHLEALNRFRVGELWRALDIMGIDIPDGLPAELPVPGFHADEAEEFFKAMEGVSNLLQEHGL